MKDDNLAKRSGRGNENRRAPSVRERSGDCSDPGGAPRPRAETSRETGSSEVAVSRAVPQGVEPHAAGRRPDNAAGGAGFRQGAIRRLVSPASSPTLQRSWRGRGNQRTRTRSPTARAPGGRRSQGAGAVRSSGLRFRPGSCTRSCRSSSDPRARRTASPRSAAAQRAPRTAARGRGARAASSPSTRARRGRRGAVLREIAATLTDEGRPTAKGGKWAAETVRLLLGRAA